MKKLMLVIAISGLTLALNAQNDKKETKKADAKTEKAAKTAMPEMKEHVCTAACKDGKHMYAHGEKGHTCTEACKKKM